MSKIFNLVTYHNTTLYFDINTNKIISSNKKKENYLEILAIFNNNKLFLVIKNNITKLFLNDFLEDGRVLISNNKKFISYIENKDNTISILSVYGFLSARKNGEITYKNWLKNWEKFNLKIIIRDIKYIKLYYWNKNFNGKYNVGDIFSKYIVEKLSGKKVIYCSKDDPDKLCAIGSIISSKTLQSGGTFWGSGALVESINFFNSNLNITAVRGPLTRNMLINTGYKCPDIYGDPALILPEFYTLPPNKTKKIYKLGIVCHWRHLNKLNYDNDILFIDILREETKITEFIDDICSCEKIISSSLHGIIIANAYGIPAKWFIIDNLPLEGSPYKKFYDYFISVNMPIQQPLILDENCFITNKIKLNMDMTVDLKINLNKLKEAFPY